MAQKSYLIKISLFLTIIFMAITVNSAPPKVPKSASNSLDKSLAKANKSFDSWMAKEKNISQMTQAYCAKKYNESIEILEVTLNKTADTQKNLTSFIDDWVDEAENNRTNCTLSNPLKNRASNLQFSLLPYALCSLLYFAFVLVFCLFSL